MHAFPASAALSPFCTTTCHCSITVSVALKGDGIAGARDQIWFCSGVDRTLIAALPGLWAAVSLPTERALLAGGAWAAVVV